MEQYNNNDIEVSIENIQMKKIMKKDYKFIKSSLKLFSKEIKDRESDAGSAYPYLSGMSAIIRVSERFRLMQLFAEILSVYQEIEKPQFDESFFSYKIGKFVLRVQYLRF